MVAGWPNPVGVCRQGSSQHACGGLSDPDGRPMHGALKPAFYSGLAPAAAAIGDTDLAREGASLDLAIEGRAGQPCTVKDDIEAQVAFVVAVGHQGLQHGETMRSIAQEGLSREEIRSAQNSSHWLTLDSKKAIGASIGPKRTGDVRPSTAFLARVAAQYPRPAVSGHRATRDGVGLRLRKGRWASLPVRPVAACRNPGCAGVLHYVPALRVQPALSDGPAGPLLPPTRPCGAGLRRLEGAGI